MRVNRRGFLRCLAGVIAAPALPRPTPALGHVGRSCTFTGGPVVAIAQRKLMARIRITKEALADLDGNAFAAFMKADLAQTLHDVQQEEERWLLHP